jgi:hypothetical protein
MVVAVVCLSAARSSDLADMGCNAAPLQTETRVKRGGVAAFDRQSPPFANGAKDGAPSSSFVDCLHLQRTREFGTLLARCYLGTVYFIELGWLIERICAFGHGIFR